MAYYANQLQSRKLGRTFGACWTFGACILIAATACGQQDASATPGKPQGTAHSKAAAQKQEKETPLVTQVYDVTDLLILKPAYRFTGMYVPGMGGGFPQALSSRAADNSGSGWMGGGMGWMGGGEAGGEMEFLGASNRSRPAQVPNGPDVPRPSAQSPNRGAAGSAAVDRSGNSQRVQPRQTGFTLDIAADELIDLIKSCIEPCTWDDVGGDGSIAPMAGMVVVSQTPATHQKIEKLLKELRSSVPGSQVISIRATWLLLDLKQLNQLLSSRGGKSGGIDRKALDEMATNAKGYLGAITCFSGQTVHIASGRSRSAVIGAIPVVGTEEVGYQPVISNPQSGAVLQVTPQLLPNSQAVLLDICSSVTRAEGPVEPIHFLGSETAGTKREGAGKSAAACGHTTVTLDRVNMIVSQLATTLKVPLGEPTLVGGLTCEPSAGDQKAAGTPQLYLFIEATAK